jgi:hypothetical protein
MASPSLHPSWWMMLPLEGLAMKSALQVDRCACPSGF